MDEAIVRERSGGKFKFELEFESEFEHEVFEI
jgi:hypothetical protein